MNFTDKQLLIFDLDGTLVDSVPDLASAINEMLLTLDRNVVSESQIRAWVGNGAQVLVERALNGTDHNSQLALNMASNMSAEYVSKALKIFLASYRDNVCVNSVLYPHVLETLKILKSLDYRLAIVTNKPVEFVAPILTQLGLNNLFEQVLGGDSLPAKKPDPLPLLHLSEQLNIAVQYCLMIGDSKNDIIAAQQANMQSVGVEYGYNYDEDIASYKPDFVASDFNQLLNCLALQVT
ncbi:MAG: phosphoglycolate phosphatase [Colwellia sp.]